MRILWLGVRRALPQLAAFVALPLAGICALPAVAAQALPTPDPHATAIVPKVPLHTEIFVEVNKYGQVSRMVSFKPSKDVPFNTQTYGNAEQAFIRHPDGSAVPGLYRLSYDYNPATKNVKRSVLLVRAGGVDPNKPGLVTVMETDMKQRAERRAAAASPLPDFSKIAPAATRH